MIGIFNFILKIIIIIDNSNKNNIIRLTKYTNSIFTTHINKSMKITPYQKEISSWMSSTSRTTTSTRKSLVKRIRAFSFFVCFSTLSLFATDSSSAAVVTAPTGESTVADLWGYGDVWQLNYDGEENTNDIRRFMVIVKDEVTGEYKYIDEIEYKFDNIVGAATGDLTHYAIEDEGFTNQGNEFNNWATTQGIRPFLTTSNEGNSYITVRGEAQTGTSQIFNTTNTTAGSNMELHVSGSFESGTETNQAPEAPYVIDGASLNDINVTMVNIRKPAVGTGDTFAGATGSLTVTGGAQVENITGLFHGNVAYGEDGLTDMNTHSELGLATAGIAVTTKGDGATTYVKNIEGAFLGNYTSTGAITLVGDTLAAGTTDYTVRVDSIKGIFASNDSLGKASAIYAQYAYIESIDATFSQNVTSPHTAEPDYLTGTIALENSYVGSLKGTFVANTSVQIERSTSGISMRNSVVDHMEVDFYQNSSFNWTSNTGGQLHLESSRINYFTGNIVNNKPNATNSAAVHLVAGESGSLINFVADTQNILIEGSDTRIFVNLAASAEQQTVININAVDAHKITINDEMRGITEFVDNAIVNINNGAGISTGSDKYSTIEFNNRASSITLNVDAGLLKLDQRAAWQANDIMSSRDTLWGYYYSASDALIVSSKINVAKGATISAFKAEVFGADPRVKENAYSYADNHNDILNEGTITFGTGTLVNSMTLKDGGILALTGDASNSYDKSKLSAEEAAKVVTVLSVEGKGNKITGVGRSNDVTGKMNIAAGAELEISNVTFSAHANITNAAGYENSSLKNAYVNDILVSNSAKTADFDTAGLAGYTGEAETLDLYVFDMLNVGGADLTALTLEGVITFELELNAADQAMLDSHIASMTDGMYVFEYAEAADGTDGGLNFGAYDTLSAREDLTVYLKINGKNYQSQYTYVDGNNNYAFAFIIPEPSTATMSLLALAGLLARRRRSVKTIA